MNNGSHYVQFAKSCWLGSLKELSVFAFVLHAGLVFADSSYTIPLFLSASDSARDGLLRLINHSADAGVVQIVASDDTGREKGPISIRLKGRQTVHIDSHDLEYGDDDDVMSDGVGPGSGNWRLELTSELDFEALAYARMDDGFLTTLHDTIPRVDNVYEIPIFNSANDSDQVSSLRLVNSGESDATVGITGFDSLGRTTGSIVDMTIAAGTSRNLTATELSDEGLGDGEDRRRLSVESNQPLFVFNLLETAGGHLINLSGVVDSRRVPWFPAASNHGLQGTIRVLNRSDDSGEVDITAFDATGESYEPVTLAIDSGETVYLSSDDLEQGDTDKGLPIGTGAGTGDWYLVFESELEIEVLAYLESADRFFSTIHDVAPGTEYWSRVPTFKAESDADVVSTLRIVNIGRSLADVRIQGIDGNGDWSPVVKLFVPAGSTRDATWDQLESGDEGLAGMLGEGTGYWQLIVRSDRPVLVLSLMESTDGHVTTLSSVPIDRSQRAFEHEQAFAELEEDWYRPIESLFDSTRWYTINYEFAKYVGFQDLLENYNYRVPTGRGLTILQAESTHTPDDLGDVKQLFNERGTDNHSRTVAEILTELRTYPLLYTRYATFSVELDSFHASTTADLRVFMRDEDQTERYPTMSYDEIPVAPAKLLNVSNTNGGSSLELVRRFDKFVEENDLVACTSHSSLSAGNWTTSGMAYNSIVVDQKYGNINAFDGAKLNDHGSPRYKPDITTRSSISSATSFSSPQVCSAAALLLERAKLDASLSNAYHSVAIKALLMAGATRFNYKIAVEWAAISPVDPLFWHGEWERTSDALSTSPKYGAGAMNILTAYEILSAGEFDGGPDHEVGSHGWDYARNLTEGDSVKYGLTVEEDSRFSAVLVWHRYIDDNFASYLPDYELELFDNEGDQVAYSNNVTSNVELIEVDVEPGHYVMEVRVASDGDSPDSLSYGLAWVTKLVCSGAKSVEVNSQEKVWLLTWDEPEDSNCRKYRLQVRSGDENSDVIEADRFIDASSHTYFKSSDQSSRYFRLYVYPSDGGVAYRYPSSPIRFVGER